VLHQHVSSEATACGFSNVGGGGGGNNNNLVLDVTDLSEDKTIS
jgi:hypothetical protein